MATSETPVTWEALPRSDAQVHTLALYKRERAVHHGCLVAVNDNYTCYAIRGEEAASCKPRHASHFWPRRSVRQCRQVAWFE